MYDISIIVPVFNAEASLSQLLDAIINQTFSNWELILVNDGSTDKSVQIINSFILIDERIQLINQTNQGPSMARNSGVAASKGQWIAFIDSDDMITNNYLEELYKHTEDVDLVCAGYLELNKKFPSGIAVHDFGYYLPLKTIEKTVFLNHIFIGLSGVLWSKLFRASVIRQHKLSLHRDLKLSEDLLFVLQFVKKISRVALVNSNIYFYNRIHETGLSSKFNMSYLSNFKLLNQLVIDEFPLDKRNNIHLILKRRYISFLMNILKVNSSNPKDLKEKYTKIESEILRNKVPLDMEERFFYFFLENNLFHLAFYFNAFLNCLRKIKNAA